MVTESMVGMDVVPSPPSVGELPSPMAQGLPPINAASTLLACPLGAPPSPGGPAEAQPTHQFAHQPPPFRAIQVADGSGSMRRALSAPHSMERLGYGKASNLPEDVYMAPSGGPMRRIASSLGMRRSSSFFWSPAAHGDFERALAALTARGLEPTATTIMAEMRPAHLEGGLKLTDVEKHLRKKRLVQSRVLGGPGTERPNQGAPGGAAPPSLMAAVAEEPALLAGCNSESELSQQFSSQSVQHAHFWHERPS